MERRVTPLDVQSAHRRHGVADESRTRALFGLRSDVDRDSRPPVVTRPRIQRGFAGAPVTGGTFSESGGGTYASRGVQYSEGSRLAVADRQPRRRHYRGVPRPIPVDRCRACAGRPAARCDEHRRRFTADELATVDLVPTEPERVVVVPMTARRSEA